MSARAWYVGVARAEIRERKFTLTRESFVPKHCMRVGGDAR